MAAAWAASMVVAWAEAADGGKLHLRIPRFFERSGANQLRCVFVLCLRAILRDSPAGLCLHDNQRAMLKMTGRGASPTA